MRLRAAALLLAILPATAGAAPPPILPRHPDALPPLPPAAPAHPSARPPASDREPDFFAGMLEGHNRARRAVGVPPLSWSGRLAATAQSWADRLRGEGCGMRHSRAPGLGENLAWAAQQHMSPGGVVALWVGEAHSYNRAANSCAPGAVCGHYTQAVWRNTRQLGCGFASCGGSEIWVCNYAPPGNYSGERPY